MKKGTLKKITLPSVIACNRWRQLKAGILTHAVTFQISPSRTECNGYGIQLHVHSSTTVQDSPPDSLLAEDSIFLYRDQQNLKPVIVNKCYIQLLIIIYVSV